MNLFTPMSKNSTGKITFFVFEAIAFLVLFVEFILAIVSAARLSSFATFINDFFYGLIYCSIIYGLGRVIDLLSMNKAEDKKAEKPEKKEAKEEVAD